MIPLKNKGKVLAPNSTYPYGALLDKSDPSGGTAVSRNVYNDMHQFFERLMDKSGITPNGLPDNNDNGFQLYQAFELLTGQGAWTTIGDPLLIGNSGGSVTINEHNYAYKLIGRTLFIRFNSKVTITGAPLSLSLSPPTLLSTIKGRLGGKGYFVGKGRLGRDNLAFQEEASLNVIAHDSVLAMFRDDNNNFPAGTYLLNFNVFIEV